MVINRIVGLTPFKLKLVCSSMQMIDIHLEWCGAHNRVLKESVTWFRVIAEIEDPDS